MRTFKLKGKVGSIKGGLGDSLGNGLEDDLDYELELKQRKKKHKEFRKLRSNRHASVEYGDDTPFNTTNKVSSKQHEYMNYWDFSDEVSYS